MLTFVARTHPNPTSERKRWGSGTKNADKSYVVFYNGVEIGVVQQEMATFEIKPEGSRIVTRRWQSPRWYYKVKNTRNHTRRYPYETRKGAADALLDDYKREFLNEGAVA